MNDKYQGGQGKGDNPATNQVSYGDKYHATLEQRKFDALTPEQKEIVQLRAELKQLKEDLMTKLRFVCSNDCLIDITGNWQSGFIVTQRKLSGSIDCATNTFTFTVS